MKTIKDITSKEINEIYSLIIGQKCTAGKIGWSEQKDFVVATFKVEECVVSDDYDTIEYGIQIDDELRVDHVWTWKSGASMSMEYRPLYNHHAITEYLLKEGFNVFKEKI